MTAQQIGPPSGYTTTPCAQLSAHQPHGEGTPTSGWWCPGVAPDQDPAARAAINSAIDLLLDTIADSTVVELSTQDELLTAMDELLDSAVHGDQCYVSPDDTVCFCVIGKVRAVLPRCDVVQPPPSGEAGYVWRCQRSAHPASPDRHVFGVV